MIGFILVGLFLAIVCAFISFHVADVVMRRAQKRGLVAEVTDRSSHKQPTPYGGGIGVLGAFLPVWLLLALLIPDHRFMPVLFGTVCLAILSWVDDRYDLHQGPRLICQSAAVVLLIFSIPFDQAIISSVIPFPVDRVMVFLAGIWFVNLFNFMDGIDGLAATEGISIAFGVALLGVLGASSVSPVFPISLSAALLGFLLLNWYPARIFMGDVGSIPIGYVLSFLLVLLAADGQFAAAVILPAYFLSDATITLLRRVIHKEKFWTPHREHFYQKASQMVGRHDSIVILTAKLNVILIILASFSVFTDFVFDIFLVLFAFFITAAFLYYLSRIKKTTNISVVSG